MATSGCGPSGCNEGLIWRFSLEATEPFLKKLYARLFSTDARMEGDVSERYQRSYWIVLPRERARPPCHLSLSPCGRVEVSSVGKAVQRQFYKDDPNGLAEQ